MSSKRRTGPLAAAGRLLVAGSLLGGFCALTDAAGDALGDAFVRSAESYMAGRYGLPDLSPERSVIKQRMPSDEAVQEQDGELFALLVNGTSKENITEEGDAEIRARNVIDVAYTVLADADVPDENIFVLEDDRLFDRPYIDGDADLETLEKTIERLSSRVTDKDVVLIVLVGHGGAAPPLFGGTYLGLQGDYVSARQFANLYKVVDPNYTVALFDFCYSHDFADRLGYKDMIALSSSGPRKLSYTAWDGRGFTTYFFEALGGYAFRGGEEGGIDYYSTVDADADNDGRVSVREMFEYAANTHPNTELYEGNEWKITPHLYWQDADPALLTIDISWSKE